MPARAARALQIHVAVPNPTVARRISEALLEARLCACAQTFGPMTSRYRWKGKIENAREWLLVVKTRAALFPAVERAVRALHPYEVAEILGTRVVEGNAAYLRWLAEETTGAMPSGRRPSRSTSRRPARRSRSR